MRLTALLFAAALAAWAQTPRSTTFIVIPAADGSATGEVRFQGLSGSNYVGFKAPNSIAATKVFTLPDSDGSANHCLVTDGSAHFSFVACDIGVWQRSGGVVSLLNGSDETQTGHLYPTTHNTFTLGTASRLWSVGYTVTSRTDTLEITKPSGRDQHWKTRLSGDGLTYNIIDFDGVTQILSLASTAQPGRNSFLASHWAPTLNNTFNLGQSSLRWAKLWVQDLDIAGSCPACGGGVWQKSGGIVSLVTPTDETTVGHLYPSADNTFTLGTASRLWSVGYSVTHRADVWETTKPSGRTQHWKTKLSGDGLQYLVVDIDGTTPILTLSSAAQPGRNAFLAGNWLPSVDNSFSLGQNGYRWSKLWVQDLDIAGTCNACGAGIWQRSGPVVSLINPGDAVTLRGDLVAGGSGAQTTITAESETGVTKVQFFAVQPSGAFPGAGFLGTSTAHRLRIRTNAADRAEWRADGVLEQFAAAQFDSTLTVLGTTYGPSADFAPSGQTGNFLRTRQLEVVDQNGGIASWSLRASANGTTTSNMEVRDNGGASILNMVRYSGGSAVNRANWALSLIPTAANTYDLGTLSQPWRTAYAITSRADTWETTKPSDRNVHWKTRLSGDALTYQIVDTDGSSAVLTLASAGQPGRNAFLSNNWLPTATNSFALGDPSFRWNVAYVKDLNISGTCTGCGSGTWTHNVNYVYPTTFGDSVMIGSTSAPADKLEVSGGGIRIGGALTPSVSGSFALGSSTSLFNFAYTITTRADVLEVTQPSNRTTHWKVNLSGDASTLRFLDNSGTIRFSIGNGTIGATYALLAEDFFPNVTGAYDLGTSVLKWRHGRFSGDVDASRFLASGTPGYNGTVNTGGSCVLTYTFGILTSTSGC